MLMLNWPSKRQPTPLFSGIFMELSMWPTSCLPISSWMSSPTNSQCKLGKLMFRLTSILPPLSLSGSSTYSSFTTSVVMNPVSSDRKRKKMKRQQQTEIMAPVYVGCVRSLGTFL